MNPTFAGQRAGLRRRDASLDLFEREPRLDQARAICAALEQGLAPCRELPWVRDVRVLGAIGAVELDGIADREALKRRWSKPASGHRPFGNVVYLTPALTIAADELAV